MRIVLPAALKKELRAALGDAVPFYRGGGTRAFLVDVNGKQYLLKERFGWPLRNERRAHELLMARKFPYVPVYHGELVARHLRCLVLDYIDGQDLRQSSLSPATMKKVVGVLAAFHAVCAGEKVPLVRCVRQLLDRANVQKKASLAALKHSRSASLIRYGLPLERGWQDLVKVAGDVMDLAGAETIRTAALHTELDFRLGRDGKIYLLDLEDDVVSDPVWDLAGMGHSFSGSSPEALIGAYPGLKKSSRTVRARFDLYQAVLAYVWLLSLVMEIVCVPCGRSVTATQREQAFHLAFEKGFQRYAGFFTHKEK